MKKKGMLWELIKSKGISQKEFAEYLGIDNANLSYWLRCGYVPRKQINRIARMTDIDREMLKKEYEAKNENK